MSCGQGPSSWPRRHTMRTHYPALAIAKAAVCGGPGPGATLGPTRSAWALASSRAHTRCGVRPLARAVLRRSPAACRRAALGLFAHFPGPPRPPAGGGGKWPLRACGPCRRGPPASRWLPCRPPRWPRCLAPGPVRRCGRPSGPPGGFRAGGLVPARPLFRCRGRLAAAVGGAVCGPAVPGAGGPGAASAPAAPAPPPGRGCSRAFSVGVGAGVCVGVRPLRRGCSWAALLGFRCAAPRRAAAVVVVTFSPRRPPVRRPPPGALVGAQG